VPDGEVDANGYGKRALSCETVIARQKANVCRKNVLAGKRAAEMEKKNFCEAPSHGLGRPNLPVLRHPRIVATELPKLRS
jgi:hypothetical protein